MSKMMSTCGDLTRAYAAFDSGDYARARAILEQYKYTPSGPPHLYLGWLYDRGLGGPADDAKAEYHFRLLADAGDVNGKYYLAAFFHRRGRLQLALALYQDAADAGHISSAYWAYSLNNTELSSKAGAQERSHHYLKLASELGHIFANRDLASQEAVTAKNWRSRIDARMRRIGWIIRGFALAVKNTDDIRVR